MELTYTTEIKQNKNNQVVLGYFTDYFELFNKIQRKIWYRIRESFVEHGKLDQKVKNSIINEIKEEYELTSRALDSLVYNMSGRFVAIKELKQTEKNSLTTKISNLEKIISELKDKRIDLRLKQKTGLSEEELVKLKQIKNSLYFKQNRLNKFKQRLNNLKNEIETHKYKICFGTKKLLKSDYNKFKKQRDSEIFYIGRAGDIACNNNFQLEYNSSNNQFIFKVRKENNLEEGKYEYGQVYFSQSQTKVLKEILKNKTSALTYRVKRKNDKILLQIMFNYKHTAEDCITRNSFGSIGVDFNKGFLSISEVDKHGNLVNTFDLFYRFGKGNKRKSDFEFIAGEIMKLAVEKGKDVVIEQLDFKVKKNNLIPNKGKKYNEMLSSFAYSSFGKIMKSKASKYKVFLRQVNPAWTSYIGKNKFADKMKLNIHNSASFVIARRGMKISDTIGKKRVLKQKPKYKKFEKRPVKIS